MCITMYRSEWIYKGRAFSHTGLRNKVFAIIICMYKQFHIGVLDLDKDIIAVS